jgi:Relaxase/Mobilisation nuclease domain
MISKTTHGSDFRGLLDYLLNETKQAEIISPFMEGDNPVDLAAEFGAVADLRPTTRLPVRHISLSFAPGDVVDKFDRASIVDRVMSEMGYQDCQYIAISHHRDDPGHDEAHDHDHIHIVANAVSMLGERVSDSHERYRIQPILREIEKEFGLKQVGNSWDIKREKAQTIHPQTDLSIQIAKSLVDCPDLATWLDRLAEDHIDVRFALRKDGAVRGVSFLKDGEIHKGSEVGASWAVVDEILKTSPTDLPLMTAANAKSQEHQLNLSPQERWEFERGVEMAMEALKGGDRFKSGRVDIKLDDQTLTVYRMRPHKQMLKASRTDEGWVPVGCPDLDKKDLDLLSKVSGVTVGTIPKFTPPAQIKTIPDWENPEYLKWEKQKWDNEEAIYQEMLRREKLEATPPPKKKLSLEEIANLPIPKRVVQTRQIDRDGR